MNETLLTKTGYDNLKKELNRLKNIERKEVANELKEALEYGDISENFAFEEAVNKKAFLEGRIQEIENTLKNAKIVKKKYGKNFADVGSILTVVCNGSDKEKYYLVTADESDPINGKITIESPIGSALYQKSTGESVVVKTPNGKMEFEIINIE